MSVFMVDQKRLPGAGCEKYLLAETIGVFAVVLFCLVVMVLA